jgi:hypothetical protein
MQFAGCEGRDLDRRRHVHQTRQNARDRSDINTMTDIDTAADALAKAINDGRGGPNSGRYLAFTHNGPGSQTYGGHERPDCGLAQIPWANKPEVSIDAARELILALRP